MIALLVLLNILKTYISISINNGSIVLTMYKLESHSTLNLTELRPSQFGLVESQIVDSNLVRMELGFGYFRLNWI